MRTRTKSRWIQPRFRTDFSVQLTLESRGETCLFHMRSVSISMRGMQVEGGKEVVDCFRAQEIYPHTCELQFRLPGQQGEQGQQQSIRVKCQMVTHRRLSQKLFSLALKFVHFEGESAEILENHLLSQQSSAPSLNEDQSVVNMPQRMRA